MHGLDPADEASRGVGEEYDAVVKVSETLERDLLVDQMKSCN